MWLFVLIPMMKEHMFIKRRSLLHECGSKNKIPQKHKTGGAGGMLTKWTVSKAPRNVLWCWNRQLVSGCSCRRVLKVKAKAVAQIPATATARKLHNSPFSGGDLWPIPDDSCQSPVKRFHSSSSSSFSSTGWCCAEPAWCGWCEQLSAETIFVSLSKTTMQARLPLLSFLSLASF